MKSFLLCWTSGHQPPRTIYYRKDGSSIIAEEDREKATRFASRKSAVQRWLSIHRWPEDYEHCLREGTVRVEEMDSRELTL